MPVSILGRAFTFFGRLWFTIPKFSTGIPFEFFPCMLHCLPFETGVLISTSSLFRKRPWGSSDTGDTPTGSCDCYGFDLWPHFLPHQLWSFPKRTGELFYPLGGLFLPLPSKCGFPPPMAVLGSSCARTHSCLLRAAALLSTVGSL